VLLRVRLARVLGNPVHHRLEALLRHRSSLAPVELFPVVQKQIDHGVDQQHVNGRTRGTLRPGRVQRVVLVALVLSVTRAK